VYHTGAPHLEIHYRQSASTAEVRDYALSFLATELYDNFYIDDEAIFLDTAVDLLSPWRSTWFSSMLDMPRLNNLTIKYQTRGSAVVTKTTALEALVIAGFVRGLSTRDVEAALVEALGVADLRADQEAVRGLGTGAASTR
jgi:hypothetical protein